MSHIECCLYSRPAAGMLQFVTRAVRIIDLMTNMCTQSFENHNGLKVFIERLEVSER